MYRMGVFMLVCLNLTRKKNDEKCVFKNMSQQLVGPAIQIFRDSPSTHESKLIRKQRQRLKE